ncbi:hypothetical protein [Pelagerythrobacter marinus]|uniref:hypothetical protein n=1 Tax=Pelagerythrobacter marinus TaxID=538382 RepID=UPI002AC9C238|nr:hypothetical protein [Pelagerythrobacter marinus]WPZ06576.1 hypothetical protein T8T98_14360 [Pelagerythrobacter marinus]
MADPIAALVAMLKANASIAANALNERIFGGELPAIEAASMPRKAVVIRPSGGVSLTGGTFVEADTLRVDVFAYGATPNEAFTAMMVTSLELRRMRPGVWAGTMLHSCNSAGGASSGREPGTEWPREFRSFQVLHGLVAIDE